ncbi:MAG: hypothetical protein WC807_14545 [Hyphomicrobium sp.]|jgi:hypothetical protein
MTEKKIATPEIAKAVWEGMDNPSSRRVRDKLIAAGYVAPSFKTIGLWAKKGGWATKKGKTFNGKSLDDAAPALTGDPRTTAEDIVQAVLKVLPPPDTEQSKAEQPQGEAKADTPEDAELRAGLKDLRAAIEGSPEALLAQTARQSYIASCVIQFVLTALAPTLIPSNPDGVAKLHLAAAESIEQAGKAFDRIGQLREQAMKTINGTAEIIEPGSRDPLAESIAAFKKQYA